MTNEAGLEYEDRLKMAIYATAEVMCDCCRQVINDIENPHLLNRGVRTVNMCDEPQRKAALDNMHRIDEDILSAGAWARVHKETIRDALSSPITQPIDAWLPIETAPRDGTRILIYDADALRRGDDRGLTIGYWVREFDRYGKVYYEDWATDVSEETCQIYPKPTHWIPLPKPPEDKP